MFAAMKSVNMSSSKAVAYWRRWVKSVPSLLAFHQLGLH